MLPRHLAALTLLFGCAGVRPPATVAGPATVGGPATVATPLVVASPELPHFAPADLRVLRDDRVEATLSASGAITVDGTAFAQMERGRVVAPNGWVLALLGVDGAVRFNAHDRPGALTSAGELISPDGEVMTLREDGHVVFTDPRHPGDPVTLRLRVEGVTDDSRCAAVVLVGVLMFRARAQTAGR